MAEFSSYLVDGTVFFSATPFSPWLHSPTIEAFWPMPCILAWRTSNRDLTRQSRPFRRLSACCG